MALSINELKNKYKNYTIKSIKTSETVILGNKRKQYTLEFSHEDAKPTCPLCGSNKITVQTRGCRKVSDLGTNEYQVNLVIPYYTYRCNNKKSNCKMFNDAITLAPKGSKFSYNIYEVIYDNIEKPCRDIETLLANEYSVKMSFDQINEIKKKYYKETFKVLIKNKAELEKNIYDEITGVSFMNNDPIDYIVDVVEAKFNICESLSKFFVLEKGRKQKYNNLLILYSSIVARMREQAAVSKYIYSLSSPIVLEKIKSTLLSLKTINDFNTNSFLRYLYKFDSDTITTHVNGILNDIIKQNQIEFNIHVIDSTKIEVNQYINYENKGMVTNKSDNMYGYKLSALYGIKTLGTGIDETDVLIPEEGYVTPINDHDLKVFKENIKCNNVKKGDYLIYDRGYTDLSVINQFNEKGIYVIVPAKKNSEIFKDALMEVGVNVINGETDNKIVNIDYEKREKARKEIKMSTKWNKVDSYDNSKTSEEATLIRGLIYKIPNTNKEITLNACVFRFKVDYIKDESKDQYYHDNEYNYGVIYTNNSNIKTKQIIKIYSKRMKIENMFKQLKQDWSLNRLYSKNYRYITMHMMSTLLSNGIFQYFKITEEGKEYRKNTIETTKEILRYNLKGHEKAIISSKDYFEIYKIGSFLQLFQSLPLEKQNKIIELSNK